MKLSTTIVPCRLRLLADSKGYVLDDTGLYLAMRGSGGKHVRIYISSQTENPLLSASFDFFVNYRQVDPAQCGKPTALGTPFFFTGR